MSPRAVSTLSRKTQARTWSATPFELELTERMVDMAEAWRKRIAALEARIESLEADRVAERAT